MTKQEFSYSYTVRNSRTEPRKNKQLRKICERHGCEIRIKDNAVMWNQWSHMNRATITAPNKEVAALVKADVAALNKRSTA